MRGLDQAAPHPFFTQCNHVLYWVWMMGVEVDHNIAVEENRPEQIKLLRAQRRCYALAKLLQNIYTILTLALPFVALLLIPVAAEWKARLALISILLVLFDTGCLVRWQRDLTKRGAKIQEQFDVHVLGLDWNKLVAGAPVDAEIVHSMTSKAPTAEEKNKFTNWYEPSIAQLPLPVGRLLCQRTNIVYDSAVRLAYARVLIWGAVFLSVGIAAIGLHMGLTFPEVILTLCVPALPLLTFALREWQKHCGVLETLSAMKGEIDRLWEKALSGAEANDLTRDARALQDAIYRNRAGNPLVVDWLYNLLRRRFESNTNHAVDALVADAKKKLSIKG